MAAEYSVRINLKAFQVREATGPQMHRGIDFYKQFKYTDIMDKECFHVVTMDQKNIIIDKHMVSMGTLTGALVHPREVFRPAFIDCAAAVAFVHNHPSGNPLPSRDDREITDRLAEVAKLLGFRLLDHVIVGRISLEEGGKAKPYYSFKEEGLLD